MNEKSSCPVLRGRDSGNTALLLDNLSGADLSQAEISYANFDRDDLKGVKRNTSPSKGTAPQPHPSQSSTIDWLRLVEIYGNTLLITTASFASVIQGLDVIERRWREH